MRRQEHTIPPSLAGNCHSSGGGHEAQTGTGCSCMFVPGCRVLRVMVLAPGAAMTDLIPVTVIEHAGPFPPSMEGVYLTYQGQSLEQEAE